MTADRVDLDDVRSLAREVHRALRSSANERLDWEEREKLREFATMLAGRLCQALRVDAQAGRAGGRR